MTLAELRPIEQHLIIVVRAVRFGSVEVQVHDGRVTQVQSSERQRFERPDSAPVPS